MRPVKMTPAHETGYFAELVCSNSLKSKSPTSPAGQLKAEMTALGSVVISTAMEHQVPAGEALGVDRDKFGEAITARIENHPLIEVVREEFTTSDLDQALADNGIVILATGPLTTSELAEYLARITGRAHLYFYDAVSPTVDASTIDRSIAFSQSRYDKGEGDDYINCPFDKESYQAFVRELVAAERAPIHAFEAGGKRDLPESPEALEDRLLEKIKYFAGCTPIEAIAEKGERSLAFGNFKPVGLTDPRTGRRPWAALQLRPENKEKTLYSLVACQTRLKWGEQKRIFRMVPGLENAEFVRFGVIHRNTYLEAPKVLDRNLQLADKLYVAGQLTGVEGYVESAAFGIYVGLAVAHRLEGRELPTPPSTTAYGALLNHLQDQTPREFAPMNINWGLLPEPEPEIRDKMEKRAAKIAAAQAGLEEWVTELGRTK
jgi:methylenetetrahydrofolate--tRNA-(uracil-5-)-methyltransferase